MAKGGNKDDDIEDCNGSEDDSFGPLDAPSIQAPMLKVFNWVIEVVGSTGDLGYAILCRRI